ncbi:hypothetical protein [Nocardia sp. NPDC004123]
MHDSKSPTQTTWPATLSVAINDIWADNFGFTVRLEGSRMVGFDLNTLVPTWDRDDGQIYDTLFTGTSFARELGNSAGQLLVVNSARDGSELGRFPDTQFMRDFAEEERGDTADGGGFFTQHSGRPDYGLSYFDAASASLVGPLSTTSPAGFQRSGNLLLVWGRGTDPAWNYLKVYDYSKKAFILQKSGDDAAGLHLSHVYIAGSYLYIENTDDSPVIDLTTMAKVSSKWRLRPLDTIGGQWTLVSKGHVTNDYTDCFGTDTTFLCFERGQLIRDTNGAYTGPWY